MSCANAFNKAILTINGMYFSGVDSQTTVTIVSSPAGIPVSGSDNTFDYPILSSVTLTCMVNPAPSSTVTYEWDTTGCYTNSIFTPSNPECFPYDETTQNVTGNDLNAEDAGTITCTATISGSDHTSESFTLRISGEQLVYCLIACIVYCKQCMLLLLTTCYCCIIHQLLWFMYRGVFTVGVALIEVMYNADGTRGSNDLTSANALNDYSYVYARDSPGDNGAQIARCVTGLGPNVTDSDANDILGGLYFNGNKIPALTPPASCSDNSEIIQVRLGGSLAGVFNFHQCGSLTTAAEGVYTCTMMNSSMMNESVRFGVYFTGRCELLDLYISSLNRLSSPYTAAPMTDTPSSPTVTVTIGSPLTLSCTSRGSPPDTFTWMKDGDQTVLQSTSITDVDYTSTSAVFRADYFIDSFSASDSGTYTCTVTNPIGSDSAVIGKSLIWCVSTNTV